MKRKTLFFIVVLLAGLYYGPIYFEQSSLTSHNQVEPTDAEMTLSTETRIYPLPVSGYESYIGTSTENYLKRHGEPTSIVENDSGYDWWNYQATPDDFVQLEVYDNEIQSIFVLGEDINTGSIRIGMNRENVYDETQLADQFSFRLKENDYQLDLSHGDLNLFPLIQYENDSFSMLYFHPNEDRIYGIRYLSLDSLIELNYYQITTADGNAVDAEIKSGKSAESLYDYIGVLRYRNELEPLHSSEELALHADEMVKEVGRNQFAFAEELPNELENERVEYVIGEQVYDSPTQFGLLFTNPTIRDLMLTEDYQEITIKKMADDLLFVFQ